MSKQKGFRKAKTPTKQEVIEHQGGRVTNVEHQLQAMTQMLIQTSQHVNQLQKEMGVLAQLVRYSTTTEGAKSTDQVVIDCLGRTYNEEGNLCAPFEGGTLYGFAVDLSQPENFIPNFTSNLLGKKVGDSFAVDLEFPEDYHAKDLAGKKASFHVSVLNVFTPSAHNATVLEMSRKLQEQWLEVDESKASNE